METESKILLWHLIQPKNNIGMDFKMPGYDQVLLDPEKEFSLVLYERTGKPQKIQIQSEYEWKKERFELLAGKIISYKLSEELDRLEKWLNANNPGKWVQCSRENTKVGDEVRNINNEQIYTIDHIYREDDICIVWNDREKETICTVPLGSFEINLNKGKI